MQSMCVALRVEAIQEKWLRAALVDGEVKLGCELCASNGLDGPWAKFSQDANVILRKHNLERLERHEKSNGHQASEAGSCHLGPASKELEETLDDMRSGGSARAGSGTSDKKDRLRYAVSEGILKENREFLATAKSIALMRDERKGNLLVRFRAVNEQLEVRSGVLGLKPCVGTSESVAQATQAILTEFCTPLLLPPRGAAVQQGELDNEIRKRVQESVSVIVTDAAAPELLATDLLRGKRRFADEAGQADMPQIKLVGRDSAHSSTRLLKRPFYKSEVLHGLIQEWCHGTDSFAQKVWHSHVLTQWWQAAVKSQEANPGVRPSTSMSAAKHRFASVLTPLSRMCQNIDAVFKVLSRVHCLRDEATWALKLSRNFSAQKAVLLHMATDAAAICNDFTRRCDEEGVDVATLNHEVHRLVMSARTLFVERQVLTLPTFTKEFMDRTDPLILLHDGFAEEIKPSQPDLDEAFRVMQDNPSFGNLCCPLFSLHWFGSPKLYFFCFCGLCWRSGWP